MRAGVNPHASRVLSAKAILAEWFHLTKGRFILSINDVPDFREVFAGFKLAPVSLTDAISGGKGTPAKELIVTG